MSAAHDFTRVPAGPSPSADVCVSALLPSPTTLLLTIGSIPLPTIMSDERVM